MAKFGSGGGILPDATSVTIDILLVSSTVFTETTGKVAADMTLSYWRPGGSVTTFAASDLAAVTSAWSAGGVKELSAANQPGKYRLDLPDAACAAGAEFVSIAVKVASNLVYYERFPLVAAPAAGGDATLANQTTILSRIGTPSVSLTADIAAVAAAAATAVWAAGTRTLTGFGTLVADAATAVWAAVTRTLTSTVGDATAANQTTILANLAAVKTVADRTLGLSQDNSVLDNTSYDSDGNLTAAILYVYDTAAHATTHDGATGLLYKWQLSGTITTGNLTLAKQLRVT